MTIAAIVAVGLLAVVVIFQIALALGAPLGYAAARDRGLLRGDRTESVRQAGFSWPGPLRLSGIRRENVVHDATPAA